MKQNPEPRKKSDRAAKAPPSGRRRTEPAATSRHQAFRRAALMSTYYHAKSRPGEDDGAPFFLKPWSIDRAIRFLDRDSDPRTRFQAAAWLSESKHRDHRAHVEHLAGGLHDGLHEHLRQKDLRRSEEHHDADDAPPSIFETAYHFLADASGKPVCKRTNFHLSVDFDEDTYVTSLAARVDVNRPPTDFAAETDPQNWAKEAPAFFLESTRGKVIKGEFVKDPPVPPPIGSEPWEGAVLENVIMSYNPFVPIDAENILNAKYSQDPHQPLRYSMACNLYRCLETDVGLSRSYGGLDVDAGEFMVTAVGNGSRLFASKRVRATEREILGVRIGYWFNKYAQYWLGPWGAAMVYEAAC